MPNRREDIDTHAVALIKQQRERERLAKLENAKYIDIAIDFFDDLWRVHEARPTRHGFDLLLGGPLYGSSGRGAIPIKELHDFFAAHRLERTGINYDLPIGRGSVQRLRRIFGFNFYRDFEQWWRDREDDLLMLSGAEFARKYSVLESEASIMRARLYGKRLRDEFWWRKDPECELLLSATPTAAIAAKLNIAASSVRRLRARLRAEADANRERE